MEHLHKQLVGLDEWGTSIQYEVDIAKENPNIYNESIVNFSALHNLIFAENDYYAIALSESLQLTDTPHYPFTPKAHILTVGTYRGRTSGFFGFKHIPAMRPWEHNVHAMKNGNDPPRIQQMLCLGIYSSNGEPST